MCQHIPITTPQSIVCRECGLELGRRYVVQYDESTELPIGMNVRAQTRKRINYLNRVHLAYLGETKRYIRDRFAPRLEKILKDPFHQELRSAGGRHGLIPVLAWIYCNSKRIQLQEVVEMIDDLYRTEEGRKIAARKLLHAIPYSIRQKREQQKALQKALAFFGEDARYFFTLQTFWRYDAILKPYIGSYITRTYYIVWKMAGDRMRGKTQHFGREMGLSKRTIRYNELRVRKLCGHLRFPTHNPQSSQMIEGDL